ncbi:MAG: glycosyltransferase [Acidimicrobiia bacterium]|nr:glycosyltransferase [Acidimicrobiia bacterium]
MTDTPIVSAVIIFCNEEEYLEEAVTSVFDQTYDNWELILVDDGSTDASTELAERLAASRPDRVRCLHHPGRQRKGMSASRNLGVAAARGRYIAYLDADDRWLPEKLSSQIELIERHVEAAVVCGPLILWRSWTGRPEDADGLYGTHGDGFELATNRLYEPPELVAEFIRHKDLVPSGALFHRSAFVDVGGADETFTDNYEDAVVFAKIGLRYPIYCADRSWYLYRQYPGPVEASQRGRTRPDADRLRGDAARLVFLRWVENHLAEEMVDDPRLIAALHDARRQIEHPHRHRIRRGLHRRVDRLVQRVPRG